MQNTPHSTISSKDAHARASLTAAQQGDWKSFFNTGTGVDLSDEVLFRGNHEAKISLLAAEPALLKAAVKAAVAQGAWDFISEVLGSKHAAACPPETLNASNHFKSPIFVQDREPSLQESMKVSLWRSILVANPWHATTLLEGDYREWANLSRVVMRNLAISTTPANEFSNPGHLVHVVDAVNASLRAESHPSPSPVEKVRPDVILAGASLIEAISLSTAPVSLLSPPLSELDFARLAAYPGIRESLFQGITRSLVPTCAEKVLHDIATEKTACPDLRLSVSALTTLLSMTPTPVSTLVNVLRDSPHGEVRSIAMEALLVKLSYPLLGKTRQEVKEIGPVGGAIISRLLSGLDLSHQRMHTASIFPTLVRSWILACAAADVAHGIDIATLNSYNKSKGGPLAAARIDFALEPLDPISPVGLARIARQWTGI